MEQHPFDLEDRERVLQCLRSENGTDSYNWGMTALIHKQAEKFGTYPMQGVSICLSEASNIIKKLRKELKELKEEQ